VNLANQIRGRFFFYITGLSRRKRRRSLRTSTKAHTAINSLWAVVHYHLERWKPETGSVFKRDDPSIFSTVSPTLIEFRPKLVPLCVTLFSKEVYYRCDSIYILSYLNKHVKNWSVAQVSTPGTRILVTFFRRPRGKKTLKNTVRERFKFQSERKKDIFRHFSRLKQYPESTRITTQSGTTAAVNIVCSFFLFERKRTKELNVLTVSPSSPQTKNITQNKSTKISPRTIRSSRIWFYINKNRIGIGSSECRTWTRKWLISQQLKTVTSNCLVSCRGRSALSINW